MIETKQKQIGERGFTYHVTQLGARQGGRVLVRLLKMVGSAAGEAIGSDEKDFDLATVGRMVGSLAETASEEDFDFLCDTFLVGTSVQELGGPAVVPLKGIFDLHFAGEYQELGQWLFFCIEANYGGFLGEGGIVQKAKSVVIARQASEGNKGSEFPLTSQNTSVMNGTSGA